MKTKYLSLLPAFALTAFVFPDNSAGKAKIELQQQENMLQIKGYYQNEGSETEQLSYKLYTVKTGRAGSSRNAQGGSFKVSAGENEILAQTRINVNPGDEYEVKLQVFRNGELVSEDAVKYTGEKLPEKTY